MENKTKTTMEDLLCFLQLIWKSWLTIQKTKTRVEVPTIGFQFIKNWAELRGRKTNLEEYKDRHKVKIFHKIWNYLEIKMYFWLLIQILLKT